MKRLKRLKARRRLTSRELEIQQVELAIERTDRAIEAARESIAWMQEKQTARRVELGFQLLLVDREKRKARR